MRPNVPRTAAIFIVALTAITANSLFSCAPEDIAGTFVASEPPEVWLGIGPPEGSTTEYNVHFYWGGYDPDGKIAFFEYSIVDNDIYFFDPADTTGDDKWFPTTVKDSVFLFTADLVADSSDIDFDTMNPYEFVRTHTFFIRAVDEQGLRSKAAYRSFTARNLSPVINITSPASIGQSVAFVPPIVTFSWAARDFVGERDEGQDPHSVRSIMVSTLNHNGSTDQVLEYIRTTPDAEEWTDWYDYNAPGDSGRFWRPPEPLAFGGWVFAVQARDEAGAISPVLDRQRNVRAVRVDRRTTGPTLIVRGALLGEVKTSVVTTPVSTINVPSGVPATFTWTADASHYGGVVTAYRYGWDIQDLQVESEWEVNYTPFVGSMAQSAPKTFYFGSHTFHVEVIDNAGAVTRVPIVLNVIPFTQEKPLLFIDDWSENPTDSWFSTNGFAPGDREHDSFWDEVLADVAGYSPTGDQMPPSGSRIPLRAIPITTIAQYRTLIWNARGLPLNNTQSILEESIRFGSSETNLIRLFMEAGGRVLICGLNAMTMNIDKAKFPPEGFFQSGWGPRYPFIYRYEMGGVQNSWLGPGDVGYDNGFAYDDCCLNVIDLPYGILSSKRRLHNCPVDNVRDYDPGDNGLRAATPIDADYAMPRLDLRIEVAAPGRFYSGIGYPAELFNPAYLADFCEAAELIPARDCFQPMYALECRDEDAVIYGAPIGFWSSRYASIPDAFGHTARNAVWGFSPVYFEPDQIKQALGVILFDEWQLPRKAARVAKGKEPR